MAPPPPTPGRATNAIRSGSSWSQPSPVQTPDCTIRTLAFDSAASSARVKKRRRRATPSGAFITDRRRLDPEQDDETKTENFGPKELINQETGPGSARMWAFNASEDPARDFSITGKHKEDRKMPPLSYRKTRALSGVPNNEVDTMQTTIERLRHLVRKCSEQHHAAAALFYADKLVSMSSNNQNDVLLFANACYINREFHRAIHVIKKTKLVDVDSLKCSCDGVPDQITLRATHLLGKCMLATKQKDECLELVGAVLPEREDDVVLFAKKVQQTNAANDEGINLVSSLALLMGDTFEAIGNRENAIVYFRIALRCDVHCFEAFSHLFDKQLLSAQEEKEMMASLDFSADQMRLLERLYSTHLGKYNSSTSVDEKFTEVEQQYGLVDNLDLNVTKAETYYYRHDIQQAHKICQRVREQDPFNYRVITVYVGTLVELGKKRELYHYAHQMVDVYPAKASAWYTVGCYYLLIQKYEAAQRYFHKATSFEPSYAPAWIAFGNAFAAQDESDQAMSSYRTASSLFPGSHLPPLYIGMEYLRTNNLVQAQEFLKQANVICPTDPLVYNELGSVFYRLKDFATAIEMFLKALELCQGLPERLMEAWEPTLFNLGYSYRKLREFDQAIYYFQSALRLSPRNVSILAALGFTYHMKGNLEQAIEFYHTALAYAPDNNLAGSMITVAFEESLSGGPGSFPEFAHPPPTNAPMTSGLTPLTVRRPAVGLRTNARLSRCLEQTYNSMETSSRSPARSSLDLSDDSSMMNLDEG